MSWLNWLLGRPPIKGVESVREVPTSAVSTTSITKARAVCRICNRRLLPHEVDSQGVCQGCRRIEQKWEARLAALRDGRGE